MRDGDGRELRGVRVSYARRYLRPTWDEIPPSAEVRTTGDRSVSGRYALKWPDSQSVELTFSKRGYLPVQMRFHVEPSVPAGYHAVTEPRAQPIDRTDVDVVLVRRTNGDS